MLESGYNNFMKIKIISGFPRLVVKGIVINNGVKIYRDFVFPSRPISFIQDLIFITRSKFNKHSINHNFEAGVYLSHLRVTNSNDKILAIGLGTGSTLILIVKILDKKGFYRCIEASLLQIDKAYENINLNEVDNSKFEIINAFAGDKSCESWGKSSMDMVDINQYDFDVLEMDCEGSELSIIQSLKKYPNYIIIELHPWHFDSHYYEFDDFLSLMDNKGYTFHFAYGHDGDYLDFNYARHLYNSSKQKIHSHPMPIVRKNIFL